jgi:hypothetical protein
MKPFKIIPKGFIVMREDGSIFDESTTSIHLKDEAAGPFIVVEQMDVHIEITAEEWPSIRKAIDDMLDICRGLEEPQNPMTQDEIVEMVAPFFGAGETPKDHRREKFITGMKSVMVGPCLDATGETAKEPWE